MRKKQITELLEKYKSGNLTSGEKTILENWYLHQAANSEFEPDPIKVYENLEQIGKQLPLSRNRPHLKLVSTTAIAAAVLIIVCFGSYFLFHQGKIASENTTAKIDIAPGKNKATLLLANGKRVVLNDAGSGQLAREAGVTISKTAKGELIYAVSTTDHKNGNTPQFNTLTTSKGEQYQVILPDGSHVWLNAASSLKYPVVFMGKERSVELEGEAYFEVAHNKKMPFKVKSQQQEVEVLGTHFNVNAYKDEQVIATTLLEGAVKVTLSTHQKSMVIKPGEQAMVNHADLSMRQVDTEDIIAWKNNYFLFDNEDLESIMRKVSRWYNVEVSYQNSALKSQLFSGFISRNKNISQVIKTLELTNAAHFSIENNKVIVTK